MMTFKTPCPCHKKKDVDSPKMYKRFYVIMTTFMTFIACSFFTTVMAISRRHSFKDSKRFMSSWQHHKTLYVIVTTPWHSQHECLSRLSRQNHDNSHSFCFVLAWLLFDVIVYLSAVNGLNWWLPMLPKKEGGIRTFSVQCVAYGPVKTSPFESCSAHPVLAHLYLMPLKNDFQSPKSEIGLSGVMRLWLGRSLLFFRNIINEPPLSTYNYILTTRALFNSVLFIFIRV